MAEPRRVLIDADYGADGIWWVDTKEEHEAPYPQWSYLTRAQRPGKPHAPRPWRERLSQELLDDLKAWNDAHDYNDDPREKEIIDPRTLQERGRDLAIQVQDELGPHGWEVLYYLGGRVHRVHPAGSWPAETWHEELLGYASRDRERAEEEARVLQATRESQQQTDIGSSTSAEP